MPRESIGAGESLVAARADIRLLTGVNANMALEIMFASERAGTHGALPRLGADVRLEMGLEIVHATKSFGAAFVRALHKLSLVFKTRVVRLLLGGRRRTAAA